LPPCFDLGTLFFLIGGYQSLARSKITSSSTAEYFAKNLQQVGFSSPVKAVLTTLKESMDNSLDACEESEILPSIVVEIKKVGKGGARNTDLIEVSVEDNGPGLEPTDMTKVFGEYLASSKFGRGRCSRGQQGIGISAATTWAQLTNAAGVRVLSNPHTMKLGEFITHAGVYGKVTLRKFLKTAFSRITDSTIKDFQGQGVTKALLDTNLSKIKETNFKKTFQAIQETDLPNPSTRSVLTVGEESLSKSILRIGEVDFFSVVTRKPKICDYKPVVIEVALARFLNRGKEDGSVQLLRFANRVPLQFDKGACAVTKAIESVNWRAYGLSQSKNSLPQGPYIFAVSVVSPFIKFKNASKETIDASDELVDEIRLAVMRAGQKLSRHIKREAKAADLERKTAHIEKFGPVLVETLVRLTSAGDKRKQNAILGLEKILGRDQKSAKEDLDAADSRLKKLKDRMRARGIGAFKGKDQSEIDAEAALLAEEQGIIEDLGMTEVTVSKKKKSSGSSSTTKKGKSKRKTSAAKSRVRKKVKKKTKKKATKKVSKKVSGKAAKKKAKKTKSSKKVSKKKSTARKATARRKKR